MVYFVIGEDGLRYGPVDLATLNLWASQDRVRTYTLIEDAANGARIPAERVPGLTFGLRRVDPTPYGSGASTPYSSSYSSSPTSYGSAPGPYPVSYPTRDAQGNPGLATASLILGIVGILGACCMGALAIPAALLAVVFGHMSLRSSNANLALWGLVLGYFGLAFGALMLVAFISMR
ncbi:MAG TPA: DUF4190 domain-containing protein [Fimbriimonadaceae bacterium]|nr:DUF4190 domain-containing protein [Fimbriimonadaceae bacterium]